MKNFLVNIVIFFLSLDKFILYKIYNFDKWHSKIVFGNHYKKTIINEINLSKVNSVAEIGCGLGDIILNVNAQCRLGLDQSKEVLDAALFVSKFKLVKFNVKIFDFVNETLDDKFDVIVMVNWSHVIPGNILRDKFQLLFNNNLNNFGYIIIDTVGDKSYTYNHDIKILSNDLLCKVENIGEFFRDRKIWKVLKLDQNNIA